MPGDPDDLVVLTSAASELQAGLWISVLESHGIRGVSPGSAATTLRWEVGSTDPYRLFVRRADVDRAREVLDNQRSDSIDIDWNEVDVGESAEVDEAAPPDGSSPFVMLGLVLVCLVLVLGAVIVALSWGGVP
ncbi:MAG: hypothetical protein KDA05_11925 [Phycisphaerales bacterium]|nr:hypothetical protein [Phycisphaerales bacterium]MCB9840240.1 hypothetical protein [Phycisphaeraceae bacterium]